MLRKKQIFWTAAVLLFSLLCCLTLDPASDDFILFFSHTHPDFQEYAFPNGRLLGNWCNYLLVRNAVCRFIIYIPVLFGLIFVITHMSPDKKQHQVSKWLGLGLFCLMPAEIFAQTVKWKSGFGIHVVPMLIVLLFLRQCFRDFSGQNRTAVWMIPVFGVLGIAGTLFAEHLTIYNLFLAVFVLLYSALRKDQKIRAYQIAYTVGSAAGAVLMFSNSLYSGIIAGNDTAGIRTVSLSVQDIIMQIYIYVIPMYAKKFTLVHMVICISAVILYWRKAHTLQTETQRRYAKPALYCIIAFTIYSIFNTSYVSFVSLSSNHRMPALETAFVFLYLLSMIYLGYTLMSSRRGFRVALLSCSTFLTVAPFCAVNPVTPRCFFADYCFWVILALEWTDGALEIVSERTVNAAEQAAAVSGCAILCIIGYVLAVNCYVYRLSIRYLREQLSEGKQNCELITIPYENYDLTAYLPTLLGLEEDPVSSDASKQLAMEDYKNAVLWYYGLTIEPEEFQVCTISIYSYLLE